MVVAGVTALTAGIAATAIARGFLQDTWWGGHWPSGCFVALTACGLGVLAASRVWLWVTRVMLVLFAGIAAYHAIWAYGHGESYALLDVLWTPSEWMVRSACAACAVSAAVVAVCIGRAGRAGASCAGNTVRAG